MVQNQWSAFRSEKGANKYIRDQQEILKDNSFAVYETVLLN